MPNDQLCEHIRNIPNAKIDLLYNILRCRECGSRFQKVANALVCSSCKTVIPTFCDRFPDFVGHRKRLSPTEQIELDNLDRQAASIYCPDWQNDYNIPRIRAVSRHLPVNGLVLDLGAADGQIATHLTTDTRTVIALEKTTRWLELHQKPSVPFVFSDIYGIPFAPQTFDAVFFGEILEHIYDPTEAVRRAVGFLKDGGSVVGTVPNFYFYRKRIRYLRGGFGEDPKNPLTHEHIRLFSFRALSEMLRDAGLESIRIAGIWQQNFMPLPFLTKPRSLQNVLVHRFPKLFATTFVFSARKPSSP